MTKTMLYIYTLLLVLVLCSGSCQIFAPNYRNSLDKSLPDSYSTTNSGDTKIDPWWKQFHSEELDTFVETAIGKNLTLKQVIARLEQSEQLARQIRASLFPLLNLTGDFSSSKKHVDTGVEPDILQATSRKIDSLSTLLNNLASVPGNDPLRTTSNSLRAAQSALNAIQTLSADLPSSETTLITHTYRFGLLSSYEIDIWGRLRAQTRAANLDLAANTEETCAALLALSGQVVSQWLGIIALKQELGLVQNQLALNKKTYELIEYRFRKGRATALDVLQQKQIVHQTESLIPTLESNLQIASKELAVLLGEFATYPPSIQTDTFPEVDPIPDTGVPADLLINRPDVRAKELSLQAAHWRVSVAKADRLPAIRLTGSTTFGAEDSELVLKNWAASLATNITSPLFDMGKRKAEVIRTEAVVRERLAAYQQTVLEAIKDVESALFQEMKQKEYLVSLDQEIEAAKAAHSQAFERYLKGLNDYLPVITSLNQIQSLERKRVQAQLTYLNIRVRLALALGGVWMNEYVKEALHS